MTPNDMHTDKKPTFKLECFEGPLDLLLMLISKNKINIYDIPIAVLLEQYLEKLGEMSAMDLDVTSEFLTMASHLIYIKSQMLLPRHSEEEEEDPRERLVRMLMEYKRYKAVVTYLAEKSGVGANRFAKKPDKIETADEYSITHDAAELINAYKASLKRIKRRLPPPVTSFQGIVGKTVTSVSEKLVGLLRKLVTHRSIRYKSLFKKARSRSDIVATFLAVLEILKIRRVELDDLGGGEYSLRIADNVKEVPADGA